MTVPNRAQRRRDAASAPLNANPLISFAISTAPKPSTSLTTSFPTITNVPAQVQQRRSTFQELLDSITADDSRPSTQAATPRPAPTTSSCAFVSHSPTTASSTVSMAFPSATAGVNSPIPPTFGSLESRITRPDSLVSASAASVFAASKPIPTPSTNAFSWDSGTVTTTPIVPAPEFSTVPWSGNQTYTSAPIVSAPDVSASPWGGNPVDTPALLVSGPVLSAGALGATPFDTAKLRLLQLAHEFPFGFATLAGLYFQQSGRGPYDVGKQKVFAMTLPWERDLRRVDQLEKDPSFPFDKWIMPYDDARFMEVVAAIHNGGFELILEAAICEWARGVDFNDMVRVLSIAGWQEAGSMRQTRDWKVADAILKLEEGEEKEKLMA